MLFSRKINQPVVFDWSGLAWQYLFFFYFSGITQLLILIKGTTDFNSGFLIALIMSAIWLIPTLLFPEKTQIITAILGVVFWACSLISLGYFLIYGQEFSQSVYFILLESNPSEASEYLSSYFSWWIVCGLALYSVGAFLLWKRVRPAYLPYTIGVSAVVLTATLLLSFFLEQMIYRQQSYEATREKFETLLEAAVPWQIVVGYVEYKKQLAAMQQLLNANARIPPIKNLHDAIAGKPSTIVLVIGESTDRQRMSLYGYGRRTTPNLDRISDQLLAFKNVISPRPYTVEVLQQMLTFADQKHPKLYLTTPSIMNIMKQAGYKTYWITNQQTLDMHNTMLATFSRQTDEQFYLNNNRSPESRQYDSVVFKPFMQVLKQREPRKFIIVHLIGTHMDYKNRYPETYARFTDRSGVPAWVKDGRELSFYNAYDNAILYNDFVVSSLIKQLSDSQPNGILLYLSDHGEEVYDEPESHRHGRDEKASLPAMYTIPFIVWTSKTWRENHSQDFRAALDRPYVSSDLIHTWADLVGLRFDGYDASKSIVNDQFKARPRLIGNPNGKQLLVDFDELEKKMNSNPEKHKNTKTMISKTMHQAANH